MRQALEHIEVLQRQLSLLQEQRHQQQQQQQGGDRASTPGVADTSVLVELPYLRQRMQQLTAENRAVRRQAAQLRLIALSPHRQGDQQGAMGAGGAGVPGAAETLGDWLSSEGAHPGVAAGAAAAAVDALELRQQLADAQAQVRQLQGA